MEKKGKISREEIKRVYDGSTKSVTTQAEKRLAYLVNGGKPETDAEREMVKEIQEAKEKGLVIYIPGN